MINKENWKERSKNEGKKERCNGKERKKAMKNGKKSKKGQTETSLKSKKCSSSWDVRYKQILL
jgi:hypothetical protein